MNNLEELFPDAHVCMTGQQYACRVIWSEEDKEFVGLCDAFPSLSWLDKTEEAALQGITALVEDILAEKREQQERPK